MPETSIAPETCRVCGCEGDLCSYCEDACYDCCHCLTCGDCGVRCPEGRDYCSVCENCYSCCDCHSYEDDDEAEGFLETRAYRPE